jgi:hypothetical protein
MTRDELTTLYIRAKGIALARLEHKNAEQMHSLMTHVIMEVDTKRQTIDQVAAFLEEMIKEMQTPR